MTSTKSSRLSSSEDSVTDEDVRHAARGRIKGEELAAYEQVFASNPEPSHEERLNLAHEWKVPLERVTNWFLRRRRRKEASESPRTASSRASPAPIKRSASGNIKEETPEIELTKTEHIPSFLRALKSAKSSKLLKVRLLNLILSAPSFVLSALLHDDQFITILKVYAREQIEEGVEVDTNVATSIVQVLHRLPFTVDVLVSSKIGKVLRKFKELKHGDVFQKSVDDLIASWAALYKSGGVPLTPAIVPEQTPFPFDVMDVDQKEPVESGIVGKVDKMDIGKVEPKEKVEPKAQINLETPNVEAPKVELSKTEPMTEALKLEKIEHKVESKDSKPPTPPSVWDYVGEWDERKQKDNLRREQEQKRAAEEARQIALAFQEENRLTPEEEVPPKPSPSLQNAPLNPLKRVASDDGGGLKLVKRKKLIQDDGLHMARRGSSFDEKKSNLKSSNSISRGLKVTFAPDESLVEVREFEIEEGERGHHMPTTNARDFSEKGEFKLVMEKNRNLMTIKVAWRTLSEILPKAPMKPFSFNPKRNAEGEPQEFNLPPSREYGLIGWSEPVAPTPQEPAINNSHRVEKPFDANSIIAQLGTAQPQGYYYPNQPMQPSYQQGFVGQALQSQRYPTYPPGQVQHPLQPLQSMAPMQSYHSSSSPPYQASSSSPPYHEEPRTNQGKQLSRRPYICNHYKKGDCKFGAMCNQIHMERDGRIVQQTPGSRRATPQELEHYSRIVRNGR